MRRLFLSLVLLLVPTLAGAQEPPDSTVVHGVLFYSPTCPHCREVMTQTLPPILGRYGDRLKVVSINAASSAGQQLYLAALQDLAIPRDRTGVPTLILGHRELVGSWEIPNLLPAIVDSALAAGGMDWPPVRLVRQALAEQGILDPDRVAIQETPASDAGAAVAATDATAHADSDRTPAAAPSGAAARAQAPASPDSQPAAEVRTGAQTEARTQAEPEAEAEPRVESEPSRTPGPGPGAALEPEPAADAGVGGPAAAGAARDTEPLDPSLANAIETDGRAELAHDLSVRERLMLDPAGNGFALAVLILMLVALGLVAWELAGGIRIPTTPSWAIPGLVVVGIGVAAYLALVEATGAQAVCGPVGHCNVVQQSPYARILGVPVGLLGVMGYAAILVAWWVGRKGSGPWAARGNEAVWWMTLVATGFSVYLTFLEPFVIGASCAWCLTSAVVTTLLLMAATPARRENRDGRAAQPAREVIER